MEILIVLVVLSIIGYVIYLNAPSTKFKKASKLLAYKKFSEAAAIYKSILNKHPEAPARYAECYFNLGFNVSSTNTKEALFYYNQVIKIKEELPRNANLGHYEEVEVKAHQGISVINFSLALIEKDPSARASKLKLNLKYIDDSLKRGMESEFSSLRFKNLKELYLIYSDLGYKSEKMKSFTSAIEYYNESREYAVLINDNNLKSNIATRIGICNLKSGKPVDSEILKQAQLASPEIQTDFYYRYVLNLLKDAKFSDAEQILVNKLNLQSPIIQKLREYVNCVKQKKAIVKINEINQTIDQLYQGSWQIEEIENFYNDLNNQITFIEEVLPIQAEKIKQIKPSLFNRILTHSLSEKQFEKAFYLIERYPAFWEDPNLLKDIGICCIGINFQRKLNESNYREVISNWLTAVYSDLVMLESIKYTTWDDDYTFTLSDSVGSKHRNHKSLPINVNYDKPTDANISIGETQRELLNQFEKVFQQNYHENSFFSRVQDFYSLERDSIDKVISFLDQDIFLGSPYFAKKYGSNVSIINAIDNYYKESSDEEALIAALPYLNGKTRSKVYEYSQAKEFVDNLIDSIESENVAEIKSSNNANKKGLIKKFKTLSSSLEDSIYRAFQSMIEYDNENDALFPLFEECILISENNAKIKYQYSKYIDVYCKIKLDKSEIDDFEALRLMKTSYVNSKDNPGICDFLIIQINNNLMNIINHQTNKSRNIFSLLDEILQDRSEMFISHSNLLATRRSEILTQLRDQGVDISILTGNDRPQNRPWEDLLDNNRLTPDGLILKQALSYFKKLSDRPTSLFDRFRNILNL